MKFGVGLPTGMEGLINPIPFFRPDDFVEMAVLAEGLGFDSVWGNDHYSPQAYVRDKHDRPPNFYEVLTVLAAVAAETKRVQLGTAVVVLPMRDLVTLAKQVATIDQLSRGRMLLGVGIGAYREEYEAARPDLVGADRGKILEEGLALLGRLYRERSVTFSGSFYRVEGLELYPKPAQSPFPILVGGHQQRAIDRAVALGGGWIPGWRPFDELKEWIAILRKRAADAGRDPGSLIVAPQLSCLVAATDREARDRYERSGMVQHRISLRNTGRDPMLAREHNLVGTPQALLEKIRFLADAGADHLACMTFCVDAVEEYREQLHMFAEEVIAPYRRSLAVADSPSNEGR